MGKESVTLVMSDSLQPYVACQTPLFMGFSKQEYWNGFPCPPPGDLSDPRIKPTSAMFPAVQAEL